MKNRLYKLLSGLVIILTFLGLGYWVGHNSMIMYHFTKLAYQEVVMVVYPKDLLPLSQVTKIQHQLNSPLKVIFASNEDDFRNQIDQSDIILTSVQFLKSNMINHIQKMSSSILKINLAEVNPDFLTHEILEYENIPLFWNMTENKLSIYSLFFTNHSQSKSDIFNHLLKIILQKDQILDWTRSISYSSTISKIDESGLAPEKKPSFLRSFDLKKIKTRTNN